MHFHSGSSEWVIGRLILGSSRFWRIHYSSKYQNHVSPFLRLPLILLVWLYHLGTCAGSLPAYLHPSGDPNFFQNLFPSLYWQTTGGTLKVDNPFYPRQTREQMPMMLPQVFRWLQEMIQMSSRMLRAPLRLSRYTTSHRYHIRTSLASKVDETNLSQWRWGTLHSFPLLKFFFAVYSWS